MFKDIKMGEIFVMKDGERYRKTSALTFEHVATGIEQYVGPFTDAGLLPPVEVAPDATKDKSAKGGKKRMAAKKSTSKKSTPKKSAKKSAPKKTTKRSR